MILKLLLAEKDTKEKDIQTRTRMIFKKRKRKSFFSFLGLFFELTLQETK